jgi:Reverse transcriptase (RNA-dependent DNA polymerase).
MLAWNRVSTAGNLTYKRYFRPVFYAYEFASVQNIADLHARLNGGSFRPGRSSRLFIPKGAGLNRSITLLHVEDQIVLQALTNILAEKVRTRRQAVEGKVVFSNQLNSDKDNIFFLESWRWCYRRYLDQIESLYTRGYKWVAYFDLAAFYDTISHELLLKTVYPNMKASTDGDTVCEWLKKWITPRPTWPLQHGIPQGPQSSDFLAEIFLLPVDEEMSKSRRHAYVRYVDDIRIFGKTELEVQAAVQKLEGICRDRGLIPQGKKFDVAELKSRKDALGTLPSIPSGSDKEPRPLITEREAVKHFREALGGRPLRVTDKSRLRYVLFRGPPSAKIRAWVLQLMRHHPEHIEAFAAYLRQFRRMGSTLRTCIDLLRFTPSQFVKGELFHLLAAWVTKAEAKRLIPIAKDLAMKKDVGVMAKWGAMVFLCRAEELGLGNYSRFALTQPGLVQSLTMPALPVSVLFAPRSIAKFLERNTVEPGLAFAIEAMKHRKTFGSLGIAKTQLPSQVLNAFVELGMVPGIPATVDPMAELLHGRYGIAKTPVWRVFFGNEYIHALRQLKQAEKLFDVGRSQWLNYQNSFNHAAFLALQQHLNRLKLPGACKTINKRGELINFGNMLSRPHPFAVNRSVTASGFDAANRRRNKLDSSHPYDSKTKIRNIALTKREQASLVNDLKLAFADILATCIMNRIQ